MQYGDACASVGSEPIGGSRGNRHGIWLSRTLDATRPRSLALDGNERSRGELPTQGAQVASTVDACAANRESHRRARANSNHLSPILCLNSSVQRGESHWWRQPIGNEDL